MQPDFKTPSDARAAGYCALTNGFDVSKAEERRLLGEMLSFIRRDGSRAASVRLENGRMEIWRPRCEMEDAHQTELRLRRWELRNARNRM